MADKTIRENFFDAKAIGSLWDVAVSLKRGNPLPIDADSVFESEAKLIEYIGDKVSTVAYPGQIVAVVNANSTQIFYIDQDLNYQTVGKLNAEDQATIDKAIVDAAKAAEDAAVKRILTGEDEGAIAEAYDTIKEIAEWIDTDKTGAADMLADHASRIKSIEDDYLTSTDKYDDTELKGIVDGHTTALEALTIKSANTTDFTVTSGVLALNDIAQNKVTGLTNALTSQDNRIKAIEDDYLTQADKYDDTTVVGRLDGIDTALEALTVKSADTDDFTVTDGVLAIIEGKRLITSEESEILQKLTINGDGEVEAGLTVNAYNVDKLDEWIAENKNTVEGLLSDSDSVKLTSALQGITLDGTSLTANTSNIIDIPVATATALGLIKGTEAEVDEYGVVTNPNTVAVKTTGELEVNAISTDKLVQGEYELILFGGSAADLGKSN